MFNYADRIKSTLKIQTSACEIEERGVKLKLTVVDTPGFGDGINNSEWWFVFFFLFLLLVLNSYVLMHILSL